MGDQTDPSPRRADDRQKFIGRKPNKIINVLPGFRYETTVRQRERLVQTWKLETECDVVIQADQGRINRFEIYGTGSKLNNAVQAVNVWIEKAPTKSKETRAWAKLSAFDNDQWYDEHLREVEYDRKQKFKGPVPENIKPPCTITVDWPEDLRHHDPPITLENVFGEKLEGLQPFCVEHEVFITPIRHGRRNVEQVEFAAFHDTHIDSAEDHFRTMVQKVRTKFFSVVQSLHVILDENEGIEVLLERPGTWWPNQADQIVPRLLSHPMMNIPGAFRYDNMSDNSLEVIQDRIRLALEAVRYEKGHYDFVVRFGCLVLNSKKIPEANFGDKYPKASFQTTVNGMAGSKVNKWLVPNEEGDELLIRLMAADHLLEPIKSAEFFGYTPTSLRETRPMFRGTWVFRDPNARRWVEQKASTQRSGRSDAQKSQEAAKAPALPSLVVVQIDWTEDEEGMYEKMEPRYYQLKPGCAGPQEKMDVKLLELGESKAWQFCLESMTPLTKQVVSPALRDFAKRVRMKPGFDITSDESFAQWTNSPSFKIEGGRLDKIYSFGIQQTCYKVEAVAMWYPQHRFPCWGINVRHMEWASHLCELERLQQGRCAEWGDTTTTFFPADGLTSSVIPAEDEIDFQKLQLHESAKKSPQNGTEKPRQDGIGLLINKMMELSTIISTSGSDPTKIHGAAILPTQGHV